MIKLLLPLLLLLGITSSASRESCEHLEPNAITLFPTCGDSSFYVHRSFDDHLIQEDAYRKRRHIYSKTIWLSGKAAPDSVHYTVFKYDDYNGKLIRKEVYTDLDIASNEKSFHVNDSTIFIIRYHSNGFISQYGLMKEGCWVYGAESGLRNTYIWKGSYVPPVVDTVKNFAPESAYQTMTRRIACGDPTGIWRKYGFNGLLVDSIDMTGSKNESASYRYYLRKR